MKRTSHASLADAEAAAVNVLLHNRHGPYRHLPRTAGWGYPEPYTRDLLICGLGAMACGNERLIESLRRVLKTLAANQSRLGHIPSLVHDPEERGASDTTPLFILITGIFQKFTGESEFLAEAVHNAMTWMEYQSPEDRVIVSQLPTSDWRDEQWVWGYGLFVNAVVHAYLRLFGRTDQARMLRSLMSRFIVSAEVKHRHVHEGLVVPRKPYYALWSYKVQSSERFDLLGNSIAILSGIAPPTRADAIVSWVDRECEELRDRDELALDLPPNLFPYIRPDDPDWRPRYRKFNPPGEYHNGGIWPFVCGFYIAALVAAGRHRLAARKLQALARLVRASRDPGLTFGFNEWFRAQDGKPCGQDWQSWSAAMYIYAAECVRTRKTPFFDEIREGVRYEREGKEAEQE